MQELSNRQSLVAGAAARLSSQLDTIFAQPVAAIKQAAARIAEMQLADCAAEKRVASELENLAKQIGYRFGDNRRALERLERGLEQFAHRLWAEKAGSKDD